MKYPNIFNNKFIAVIAGIIAVGYFVGKLSLMDILFGVAWLFGAVFTWKKTNLGRYAPNNLGHLQPNLRYYT